MFVGAQLDRAGRIGFLGLTNPGFWVLGAGLELGYLLPSPRTAASSARSARSPLRRRAPSGMQQIQKVLGQLDPGRPPHLRRPAERCRSIIELQLQSATEPPQGLESAGRQPRTAVVDVPAAAARAPHDHHVIGGVRRTTPSCSGKSPRSNGSSSSPGSSDELRPQHRRAARDPAAAAAATHRRRPQARLHRRRARPDPAAGRADSRAGRALHRPRAPLATHRRDHRDARRDRPVDPRSAAGVRRDGRPAHRAAAARARRARPGESMSAELPRWAAEMRDLFRSGSPRSSSCTAMSSTSCRRAAGCCRSPPFSSRSCSRTYDVVLRYDRSRGVRATRGGEDWGDWLQSALGREVEFDDADARAGIGARAHRSVPAAHAEPAGSARRAGADPASASR